MNLYRLQQIDTQLDRARLRLLAIDKILEDDVELKQAVEKARAAEVALSEAEKNLKQAEMDVRDLLIKIEQNESSLYGRSAHTPKELTDLQNDVASIKRYKTILEDRQLDAMIACEKAESDRNTAQEELQAVRQRIATQNQGLNQEQQVLRKETEKLSTERQAAAGGIPPDLISLYEQLRQQKRGLALATVSDNSCDACGSTLNKAQIQSARSAIQMAFCPSCGRILYVS